MKKRLICWVAMLCMVLTVTGCSTSVAFTFNVETGDSIKVSLDTSDDYGLTSSLPFEISCGDEVQSQGTFILGETYEQYVSAVETDANATLLDSGTKDGNEYIFWSYNDSEYNYAVKVGGSDTGLLIGNIVSEESAKECFERLTISVAE